MKAQQHMLRVQIPDFSRKINQEFALVFCFVKEATGPFIIHKV
jgi:hypothetical protein